MLNCLHTIRVDYLDGVVEKYPSYFTYAKVRKVFHNMVEASESHTREVGSSLDPIEDPRDTVPSYFESSLY